MKKMVLLLAAGMAVVAVAGPPKPYKAAAYQQKAAMHQ